MSNKKAKKETLNLAYRVAKIQTTKFYFKDISDEESKLLFDVPSRLDLAINLIKHPNPNESNFTVEFQTSLEDKADKTVYVEHSAKTIFQVDGLKLYLNEKEQMIDLPALFLAQIYGIAFSHARALLAVELAPTCYRDKYMLPIIDPMQLINGTLGSK